MSDQRSLTTAKFEVRPAAQRYEGRAVVITGAAQGLGRVVARWTALEGASVVVCDLNEEKVQRTAELLAEETGQPILGVGADLSKVGGAEELVERALERFDKIDTLVNNAAALIRVRLVDIDEELMQQAVDGNVWTTLRCCKAVLPHMIERGYGRIVNIGGEAWRMGTPFHTLLAGVGKGSAVGLTATLAGEVIHQGITVNCVSPGGMESEADGDPDPKNAMTRDPRWTDPDFFELMKDFNPKVSMGRLGHPSEIAAAVAFLGAPEASFITGQHLGVNGGIVMI